MNIKFNWGTGIFLVIIVFFILIFSFIYYASTFKINLVEDNYYEKELKYEEHITKLRNTDSANLPIGIIHEGRSIQLVIPGKCDPGMISGKIQFYRPSDFEMDRFYTFSPDKNGVQNIDLGGFPGGKYIIKIDWMYDSVEFFQEQSIFIQ